MRTSERAPRVARFTALLALAALVVLAACGSSGEAVLTKGVPGGAGAAPAVTVTTAVLRGPPASGPAKAVCDILGRDDVARVLGNAVNAGTGDGKFCSWGTQVDKGSSADVRISVPAAGRGAAECAIQEASLPKEAKLESVGGIGTTGTWAWQNVAILVQGTLVACWNEAVVRVLITGEHDEGTLRGYAVSLAQLAHDRL